MSKCRHRFVCQSIVNIGFFPVLKMSQVLHFSYVYYSDVNRYLILSGYVTTSDVVQGSGFEILN